MEAKGSIPRVLAEHHTGKWPDSHVRVHTTLAGWSGGEGMGEGGEKKKKKKKGNQGEDVEKGRKQAETEGVYICKEAQATRCHVNTRQIVGQAAEAKRSLSCFSLPALTTPSFELTPAANSDLRDSSKKRIPFKPTNSSQP